MLLKKLVNAQESQNDLLELKPQDCRLPFIKDIKTIDLRNWIRKQDYKFVTMHPVPKCTHLNIKCEISSSLEPKDFYNNLIQVTVKGFSVIYDL